MKNDIRFRQKVFESIEGLSCTSKLTGGMIKSTGVFIHEDGTGGYWTEFDWGDDEDEAKSPKNNVSIFGIKSAQITNNYISVNRNISEQFLNSIMVMNSCYIEEDRKRESKVDCVLSLLLLLPVTVPQEPMLHTDIPAWLLLVML